MKKAADFGKTAERYSGALYKGMPPQKKLIYIMDQVDRIQGLVTCSEQERQEALDVCWDSYAKVMKYMDSSKDEAWGGDQQGWFPLMEADTE